MLGLTTLPRSEKEALLAEGERREADKRDHAHDFAAWVEDAIYPYHPENQKTGGTWRLGRFHREEWIPRLERRRLMVYGPRYHGKSFFFAELWPLYCAKYNAPLEVHILSESDSQAYERLDHVKLCVQNTPSLTPLAGRGARLWNRGEVVFANGSIIKAQGFWSRIRGGHCDLLVGDDLISSTVIYSDLQNQKSIERFRMEVLPQAKPETQVVITGTLQREDDLYSTLPAGIYDPCLYDAILDEENRKTLWPEVWSWEALMARKAELDEGMGAGYFEKEYRQQPMSFEGALLKRNEVTILSQLPNDIDGVYTGWDLGVSQERTADYTAKVTIGADDNRLVVMNAWRGRLPFAARLEAVKTHAAEETPVVIGVEANAFQMDFVQALKGDSRLPIKPVTQSKNKRARFAPVAVMAQTGRLVFGPNLPTWYLTELLSFRGDGAGHDDAVDATEIAVRMAQTGRSRVRAYVLQY